jgi:hypothetical protein
VIRYDGERDGTGDAGGRDGRDEHRPMPAHQVSSVGWNTFIVEESSARSWRRRSDLTTS